jgi:hypothetical protein
MPRLQFKLLLMLTTALLTLARPQTAFAQISSESSDFAWPGLRVGMTLEEARATIERQGYRDITRSNAAFATFFFVERSSRLVRRLTIGRAGSNSELFVGLDDETPIDARSQLDIWQRELNQKYGAPTVSVVRNEKNVTSYCHSENIGVELIFGQGKVGLRYVASAFGLTPCRGIKVARNFQPLLYTELQWLPNTTAAETASTSTGREPTADANYQLLLRCQTLPVPDGINAIESRKTMDEKTKLLVRLSDRASQLGIPEKQHYANWSASRRQYAALDWRNSTGQIVLQKDLLQCKEAGLLSGWTFPAANSQVPTPTANDAQSVCVTMAQSVSPGRGASLVEERKGEYFTIVEVYKLGSPIVIGSARISKVERLSDITGVALRSTVNLLDASNARSYINELTKRYGLSEERSEKPEVSRRTYSRALSGDFEYASATLAGADVTFVCAIR